MQGSQALAVQSRLPHRLIILAQSIALDKGSTKTIANIVLPRIV